MVLDPLERYGRPRVVEATAPEAANEEKRTEVRHRKPGPRDELPASGLQTDLQAPEMMHFPVSGKVQFAAHRIQFHLSSKSTAKVREKWLPLKVLIACKRRG